MVREDNSKRELIFNLGLLVVAVIVVLVVLFAVGALDDEKREIGYKTDAICMLSGFLDGTEELVFENETEEGRQYSFSCKARTVIAQYDPGSNLGLITKLRGD